MESYSKVRGFNYQPSRGTTSLENWLYYDPELAELELRRGKEYFPGFNTVRYWLSWDAYLRDPAAFKAKFEKSLQIADRLGLKVIACLLNRWHDASGYDNGGVYIDNLIPEQGCYYRPLYREYVADVVKTHCGDGRIMIWDICNEPFSYRVEGPLVPVVQLETDWLTELYQTIKEIDGATSAGVSSHWEHGREGLERVEPISDVLMIHPYFEYTDEASIRDPQLRKAFEDKVAMNCAFGREVKKPMLVTETCWGAYNDDDRVNNMKFTLEVLSKNGLGFVCHALHYSRVADLHWPEDGHIGAPGNLAFINKDGSLRKGHEAWNRY